MNSRVKIRLFFALEVIVWLLVIVLIVGSVRYYYIKKQGEFRTYRIFMQDVDGLIEGSSVRMMGVPIGYIKNINIVQDEVYLKFVVTDKSIEIPQGAIATVEFNGMAGSKSLEIYSPDSVSKASGQLITIKKTNRLGAALGLFDDMFAKFDSILVRCNHFSGELEQIFPKSEVVNKDKNSIEEAEKSIGLINNMIEEFNNSRKKLKENLKPKSLFKSIKEDIQEDTEENNNEQK